MPPAPRHHARKLSNVKTLLLQLAAEIVKLGDFEIETHTLAPNRSASAGLMQRNGAIASGSPQSRVKALAFMAKVFDQLESQKVAIKNQAAVHVLAVNHGVVEGQLAGLGGSRG